MSKTAPTPNGADAKPVSPPAKASDGAVPAGPYSFLLPPVEPDEIGRVGHYRVLHLLGSGGMGMVFAAEDIALQRHVAIKVMHPELASDPSGGWQRFLREARALGGVKHQHLVTVYQAFQDRGTVFLVMELLEGESLEARIRRPEPLTLPEILQIGREIAVGLAALHGQGLIHRDIKPANIWLERKPQGARQKAESEPTVQVKILDLGLVRSVEDESGLTASGMVMGTPAYMSLEQVRGLALDHRTDLFSLGCVLYAMCTGKAPFQADNPVAQATALIRGRVQPASDLNPTIPKSLSDFIMKLLAKEPEDRPASALEVVEMLRDIRRPSPTATEIRNPEQKTEPIRKALSGPKTERIAKAGPTTEPIRKLTHKTQVALVSDLEPNQDTERPSRRTKAKRKKKKSFIKQHGLTLLALLWLIVATLLVISVVGRGDKSAPNNTPDPTPQPLAKGSEKGPNVVYLSEFPTSKTVSGALPPPPPGYDGTIRVGGRLVDHGLFMHAAPPDRPPARITYKLGKEFSKFNAEVGFNDTAPPNASAVRFIVYFDGVKKWTSSPIQRDTPLIACDLDVKSVNELTLEVTCDGTERGAHAVWLDPRVKK
ncbi:MAG: protein kinase [Planctomycetes bacterium]|nr:protein kinase [Planctomycetota bacterium]